MRFRGFGFYRWLRAAELTCDRAALLVAQDPRIVISTLMKLSGGSPSFAAELNIDAFLEQVSLKIPDEFESTRMSSEFLHQRVSSIYTRAMKLLPWNYVRTSYPLRHE